MSVSDLMPGSSIPNQAFTTAKQSSSDSDGFHS